ncbi:ENTH domain-containing protein C19F8.03c [Wallemia ichthyophaga EXF-994]|uniref:ENTH domain-containing protein C19F8.03c n=1 Tax=Wallemia ichthyophaga (strain EXF-994 / CBS 113033) TaxID=1299270 RepID=R9AJJ7_WALI9|nr:ENTH domain-containing protein C19F8.03c [Wallemia ichthyophaga EXF-994]EOR00226.1 ENTH domain-containing protein C19F8.03c [Wallemia ichthyophaga EXF-994]
MSSANKLVKAATKPKNHLPKSKVLEPIISASFTDQATLSDILRALSDRLREPNSIIVFKSLVIAHSLFRNGDTDNILDLLSHHDHLKLRRVASIDWDGRTTPQNIQAYATYLDLRIKAYRDLKHDVIKVQSETRGSSANSRRPRSSFDPTGRPSQLRLLTVEKGLLREVKHVQKLIDSITACRFFLDDLEDDVTVAALQLNVKDLLQLFTALNEGVINVLESYFEMSKVDATEALSIYRTFCRQTESVVQYLSIARRLHNVLNVMVPNIKHAPLSLYGALKEYLEDPNFEQNRIEYKHNKSVIDGESGSSNRASHTSYQPPPKAPSPQSQSQSQPQPQPQLQTNKALPAAEDFLDSIESDNGGNMNEYQQPYPQQQMPSQNIQQQSSFFQPQQSFIQPQNTGFLPFAPPQTIQPQFTGFGVQNPYQQQLQTQMQPQQQQQQQQLQPQPQPQSPFTPLQQQQTGIQQLQPQGTGMGIQQTGLQTQTTGFNPFRASLMPMQTGNTYGDGQQNANNPLRTQFQSQIPTPPQTVKPVTAQKTGSRNPFSNGLQDRPQQVNSFSNDNVGPTLNSLAFNAFNKQEQQQQQQQMQMQQEQQAFNSFGNFDVGNFGLQPQPTGLQSQATGIQAQSTGLPSQTTGLQGQMTGQGNLSSKKFQPTSSFGTTLEKQFDLSNPYTNNDSNKTNNTQINPFRM